MAYENEPFVKIKGGVRAPRGFHYMPNGKLMSDADHIAIYGYINKTITNVIIDTTDLDFGGETRTITVQCDQGGIFSIEIYDDSGSYYSFTTKTFSSTRPAWKKIESTGSNIFSVKFPVTGGSLKKYTIDVRAEIGGNIKTKHAPLQEARFVDNTIDYKASNGSDSDVLRKILYQDAAKTFTLSCIAPSSYDAGSSTVDGATTNTRIVLDDNVNTVARVGDLVTISGEVASSIHMLVTKINPDGDNAKELQVSVADTISDGIAINFTPPFNTMTPHDGDSSSNVFSSSESTGKNFKKSFKVIAIAPEGRTFTVLRTPTTADLLAYTDITFGSSALAIEGENTSSDSVFHRFPVTNIANLAEGMSLDPSRSGSGQFTTTPAFISQYLTTKTSTEPVENKYSTDIKEITLDDVRVPGIESTAEPTAIDRNGRITAQAGNIVFDVQQLDALKADSNVRILAYGTQQIQNMTGMSVVLSDVVVTPTEESVTTSSAVINSTQVIVTGTGAVSGMPGVTSFKGVNISSTAANPTAQLKTTATGAGSIILSSAQTLESGQTLTMEGTSTTVTITGTIEVSNMPIGNVKLYFDVERFLRAT